MFRKCLALLVAFSTVSTASLRAQGRENKHVPSLRLSNPRNAMPQPAMTAVGGTLTSNTTWSPAQGMILVFSDVIVPTNITLTIQAGTLVRLTNNSALRAQAGGAIAITGAADNQVVLERLNRTNNWAELTANGTNASLTIRHADISGGQTTLYNGASGLLEDSCFHDFIQQGVPTIFNQPIILTHFASPCAVRRCHVRDYYETLWRHGENTIEDCLFENMVGDALDFDAALAGSVIRRCTIRHGNRANTDAVDIGNDGPDVSIGVTIESCLMYDFPFDKGISIGETSRDIVVTNCLIYNCLWGIGVKDSSTARLFNNTVTACEVGLRLYNKIPGQGSGWVTNSFNNILWGNTSNSLLVLDGGSIAINYSDVQGTNWPGLGNLDAAPLFLNPALHDYRLAQNSPCAGAGRNGADMGAHFPVGSVLAPSHPRIDSVALAGTNTVLRFWADSEKTYSLLCSDAVSGSTWIKIADVPTAELTRSVSVTNSLDTGTRFYRLAAPAVP